MSKQIKQIDFIGQEIYVGMDVHKKSWEVKVSTAHTNPTNWPVRIQKPFIDNLKKYLDNHYPGASVNCAYEAGYSGFWIHEQLSELGYKTIVINPSDVPTSDKERKQKTDKRDAKKISKSLKNAELTGIYIPSQSAQELRSIVRERYSIVKSSRRIKNQIKSHLAFYNVEIDDDQIKKHWSRRYIKWLKIKQEKRSDETLSLMLERLELLRLLLLKANRKLRALSRNESNRELFEILVSVPGIGLLTGMQLISEIIDMERFASYDQLCSYVGYIPNVYSSSEKEIKGKMTSRRNKRLRTAIIESSWSAIKSDPILLAKYENYRKRMSGQKAIVRIARILLRRIRYVWLNNVKYERMKN